MYVTLNCPAKFPGINLNGGFNGLILIKTGCIAAKRWFKKAKKEKHGASPFELKFS